MEKEKINNDYDFKGRKNDENTNSRYNYSKSNSSIYISEKNKKGELNYLENYLSTLLKDRTQLEKTFSEIPEHPRTLKDIKLKSSIKDKIAQNEKEVFDIQQKLKKIRGN